MASEQREEKGASAPRKKPFGGFVLISVRQIMMAWSAHQYGHIHLRDLRTWFALYEMRVRRCCLDDGQTPNYATWEIQRLIGGAGGGAICDSLRRLKAVGLLRTFSEDCIEFTSSLDDLTFETAQIEKILGRIRNDSRLVPVPRRILRLMAGGARRTLIAVILGHIIRCMFFKGGKVYSSGCVKSNWIVDVFGISERMVHEQRAHLIALGWLIPKETPQRVLNNVGLWLSVNLNWSQDSTKTTEATPPPEVPASSPTATLPVENTPSEAQKLAVPPAISSDKLAAPSKPLKPLRENENPETASGEKSGSCLKKVQNGKIPDPTLHNVRSEDLQDPVRLMALHIQAVQQGTISNSEADRLNFFAAANHARVIGSVNPPGLFVRIVRSKLFKYCTQDDEDVARAQIRRVLYPTPSTDGYPRGGSLCGFSEGPPKGSSLSDDARFVRDVVRMLRPKGVAESSTWRLVNREHPEWTRERWDAASAELNGGLSSPVCNGL